MLYYSYQAYMNWYNWYYGIKEEEPIVLKEIAPTPHDFPSCNFTQATLNEAIIASINDPPPPKPAVEDKSVSFAELPKKIKTKAKKKKGRRY